MKSYPRREFLAQSLAIGLPLTLAGRSLAQWSEPDPELAAMQMVTPEAERAINQALTYLQRRQREDGSIGSVGYDRNVAVAALVGMAYISNGSVPNQGPFGQQVTRCVDYVLMCAQPSGMILSPSDVSHGPMYGHGFATMFLAEVYGMTPDSAVREKLSRAVQLIVNTQNEEGGWRYKPERADADVSVTVCQVMALRAARNTGIYVPSETIDRCVEYIKQCQNSDGGFMYQAENGGVSAFPRSAAAVAALYSAGLHNDAEIKKGLSYLMEHLPQTTAMSREGRFFYGQYYGAQAMWHAGGDHWQQWYPAVRDVLIAQQRKNGSFSGDICPEYCTAMASIVLQMPNNYLPIFQR